MTHEISPPHPLGDGGDSLPQELLDLADAQGGDPSFVHPLYYIASSIPESERDRFIRAWSFALAAHRGQVDKAGFDYFEAHVTVVTVRTATLAPLHLRTDCLVAAMLHDVVEDTTTDQETAERVLDSIGERWGEDTRADVDALSQRKTGRWFTAADESWPELERRLDFMRRVVARPVSTVVKLADNLTNSDPAKLMLIKDATTRDRLKDKYRPERNRLRRAYRDHFGRIPGMYAAPQTENEMGDRR